MKWITLCVAMVLAVAMVGCASEESLMSASSATQQTAHGECLVCKRNADLACVDVDVDKNTPRAEYNGKTYYFCSDECREEFLKHPAKYAGK
jgi:YHS domain-containing protein